VHRDGDVSLPNSSVRRVAREAVVAHGQVPCLTVVERAASELDPFVKFALRTPDGRVVEAVRIPLERAGRFSVCVSSQVGCALACAFCATGRLGLARNLETWEIVEQVRVVKRSLDRARGERVHGVVFQGMGEPLANLEQVLGAIRVLTDPSAGAIDARKITVCTSGLPSGIRRLAREAPRVRLGWSIGSAKAGRRVALMPIDGAHPLSEVYAAGVEHAELTGLAPLWAVTLLAGVNDGEEDASALAELAERFRRDTGKRPRISVIPYNRIADDAADPFRRASDAAERSFRETLHRAGTSTHKRYSGGSDIGAACGQLAARG
jgi:23S rRNA (adenine2503-C2)-methyltransferase